MKQIFEDRLVLIVVLGLVVIGFIILAAGLPGLQMQTGGIVFETPIPGYVPTTEPDVYGDYAPPPPGPPNLVFIVVGLVGFLFVLFLAYRYPRIRYGLLGVSVWTAVLLTLIYLYNKFGRPPDEQSTDPQVLTLAERFMADLTEEPPAWFDAATLAFTLVLLAFALLIGWWVWRRMNGRETMALDSVGRDAEAALAELRSGANLQDTIVRCYFDMNHSLAGSLGLRRPEGMTPREFEEIMTGEGLPPEEVQRLTRLFEKVRYGAADADAEDQAEAIACLEAIVKSIQQTNASSGSSGSTPAVQGA
jgi:hypothetical protein